MVYKHACDHKHSTGLYNRPGMVNCPTGCGHAGINFLHLPIFHLAVCPMISKADTQLGFDCPALCDAKGMTFKALALHWDYLHADT